MTKTIVINGERREATPEEVIFPPAPLINEIDMQIEAQTALRTMTALSFINDEALPDTEKRKLVGLFPVWQPNEAVIIGDLRRHGLGLYECIQGHTTQTDWEPNNTPALWKVTLPDGEVGPWSQPQGAHDAYQIGDKVTHNNKTWVSTHANNVWEPGVFGWAEDI